LLVVSRLLLVPPLPWKKRIKVRGKERSA